jgi:hypothetical protein
MLISKEVLSEYRIYVIWAEESGALEATEWIAADGKESGKWNPRVHA